MKKIFLYTISSFLLLVPQLLSQQFSVGSPEWLIDMFFVKSSFPDKANYYTGEMTKEADEKTIGEELNGEAKVSFHQIRATNSTCVFSVEVETDKKTIDFYSYLVNDNNDWKITAVRRFLLPSFVYIVRDSLLNLDELSESDSVFLLSLQLFTASDKELKNYLTTNLNKFQELISLFINNEKDKANIALASAGCNAIYTDKKYPGCVFIQILTFEKMEAGFIQAADAILLPQISFLDYIYIEEVSPGWFIYRTI
jgi:hypothetical protein